MPALEKALQNDDKNYGFYVKNPEDFIEEKYQTEVADFIENEAKYTSFFNKVDYYFDAKSHNFSQVSGIDIDNYKSKIISEMLILIKSLDI